MKIDSIRVGYTDVGVYLEDLKADDCFGYFESYPSPKISVHNGMSPLYVAATAFHELLEAISSIYGLDLTEAQIRTIENSLVDIVRRNPGSAKKWVELLTSETATIGTAGGQQVSGHERLNS